MRGQWSPMHDSCSRKNHISSCKVPGNEFCISKAGSYPIAISSWSKTLYANCELSQMQWKQNKIISQHFNYDLTHWGWVTHICVSKLTIIGSDNGLSPEQRQAIIWINARILLIGPLGKNFSEILIEIQTFPLKKIRMKMSSAKCCSFHLGLNVLREVWPIQSGVGCFTQR